MKATNSSKSLVMHYVVLGVVVGLLVGCAGIPLGGSGSHLFDYFGLPRADDPWTAKISAWQRRESAELVQGRTLAAVAGGEAPHSVPAADEPALRSKFAQFRAERRRIIARDFAAWIQSEARAHYVADGPVDHWATLEETLERNGDDCDGLELLVFHGLRDLGFRDDEVFRAIVYRPEDGQHHMVTFWFEDPNDPWVIDPTGAMSSGMPRMSNIPGWRPLKVFSADREFSARPLAALGSP